MYENYLVRIPEDTEGISIKNIKGAYYVYYTYDRVYDSVKKHTKPLNKTIGKVGEPGEKQLPAHRFFYHNPEDHCRVRP